MGHEVNDFGAKQNKKVQKDGFQDQGHFNQEHWARGSWLADGSLAKIHLVKDLDTVTEILSTADHIGPRLWAVTPHMFVYGWKMG